MPNDREGRPEGAPVLLPWGLPARDSVEAFIDPVGLLAGGAGLLLWTALVLWLTA